MAEYIEREGLMRELGPFEENDFFQEMSVILQIVAGRPAADVEPVRHGRWKLEPTNPYDDPSYKNRMIKRCSCCGWQNACSYNYCPNCGANMDGEA